TGDDAGSLQNSDGTTTLADFTGMENLTGGSESDTFTVTTAGSLSGTVKGGAGIDQLIVQGTGTDTFKATPTTVTVGSKTITLDTIEDVTIGDTGSSLAFNAKGEDVELRPGKIIVHFSDGSTRAFKTAGSITLTLGDKDGTQGRIVNDTSGLFN